jgi:hypothetical protein
VKHPNNHEKAPIGAFWGIYFAGRRGVVLFADVSRETPQHDDKLRPSLHILDLLVSWK